LVLSIAHNFCGLKILHLQQLSFDLSAPLEAATFSSPMTVISGRVQKGVGDFGRRMTNYPDVFRRATGESLFPGTLNVKVDRKIPVREEFRILGKDIKEPEQDLLFERCSVNNIPAYRIRPYNLRSGEGGHGDDVIEIVSAQEIPNVAEGSIVEITFRR
jgi:CTP-dependent riboflavin kinase